MGKLRVQDVAKELGVPVKEVREVLKEWGIDKGNFAYLNEEELQIVYDHFSVPKEKPVENGNKAAAKEETVVVSEPPKEEKQKEEKTEPKREEKRHRDQRQRDKRHHERARQPAREAPPPKRERAEERERPRRTEERRPFPARVPAPPPMPPPREQKVEEKPQKPQPKEKLSKSEEQMLKKLQQPVKKEKKEEKEEEIKIVQIPEVITVRELADLLRTPPNQIMAELLKRGILATINQTVPSDIAVQVAEALGFLAEIKSEEVKEEEEAEAFEEGGEPRPPVVVVMGHVDHGKTTLLDTIRKTRVAEREKGGITQHIGASVVEMPDGRRITFLDTPGHEAFTSLRARGAQVTDIAVLVVAADDGVMPQTVEAINHAKAFNVPIIVAVNKIDKPGADPQRVRRELSELGLIPEEWGGDTVFVDVSAKTGQNVETLLEYILLVADLLELKANPNKPARGTIIESKLDKQRGVVATVLVQEGTLKLGDIFVAGTTYGRVRAMFDDKGRKVKEAGPSVPVEVLGFEELPMAGDQLKVVEDERKAKQIAEQRKLKKEQMEKVAKGFVLEEVFKKIQEGELKELRLILKTDTLGSLEALKKSLSELSTPEVSVRIIHGDVGGITENDVMLAKASGAVIIGFNTRPDIKARETAEAEKVDIRLYGIIYEAIEDVKKALKGMLKPVEREVVHGTAEVRATFKIKGAGTVAGCYVLDGKILRNARARLVRNGVVVFDGKIESLKRYKEDVQEVAKGFECGIKLKDYNDVKVGDIIECYEVKLEKPQ
ncbi:translation initiation factor IF-2 [Hydrogenobacter sp. T-2]|uniref:translation initiation factor IF-2 n=1 Tax=Pampinifervens diazotrophicum TaxID=1632018 RepID=UPI002B262349|nr:translation initiation factor IF-2 [Hydrogenobacter sp. T-2]WPM31963.1 translation initiation factor IF-2 [Hydrogenobacter sp. T-2]